MNPLDVFLLCVFGVLAILFIVVMVWRFYAIIELGNEPPIRPTKDRNRWIAFGLALGLGGVGAHKFYLGEYGLAVMFLLFFWTGIPLIFSIADVVFLLAMNQVAFDRMYNV